MSSETPTASPTTPEPTPRRYRRSRRRLWLLRIAVLILAPTIFLAAIEVGLRVFGFGYPSSFLQSVPGRDDVMGNPRFGWRYFPPGIARMPQPFAFPRTKAAGTYRIFVLGESAALGDPEPAFGFGRVLEVMLRERFPALRFEVINAAMVAINSHVIRAIAEDCATHDPDLFVALIGNNEVVGPFGPGTVFAGFSSSLAVIRSQLTLEQSRVFQLARRIKAALKGDGGSLSDWKGIEFFLNFRVADDDPRMEAVYAHFRANLGDIATAATSRADLVLCTMPVNLADTAPFASQHRNGLPRAELSDWDGHFKAAVELQSKGSHAEAAARFAAAAEIDDRFAELHYRLGKCRLELNEREDALKHFERARDLDALRFRADSRINAIIREVAAGSGPRCALADTERAFAASELADRGVPGRRLFYEHAHFTFEGNYLLACEVFAQVVPRLPESARETDADHTPPSIERCAAMLGLTDSARYTMGSSMLGRLSRPPFTNQCDNAEQLAYARGQVNALRPAAGGDALAAARDACRQAVEAAPDDAELRGVYANLLSASGDYPAAAAELARVLERRPFDAQSRIVRGGLLIQCEKLDEAAAELRAALEQPRSDRYLESEAHFNLGMLHERAKRGDEAVASYRDALRRSPNHIKSLTNLGLLLRKRGAKEEGNRLLRQVVEVDSEQPLGHFNLAVAAAQDGRLQDAVPPLRTVVRLQPENLTARVSLADALFSTGQNEEALGEYNAAIRQSPDSAEAHFGRGLLFQRIGRVEDAIADFNAVLRSKPGHVGAARALQALRSRSDGSP